MGRPSKGKRIPVTVRMPVPIKDALRELAREQGVSENDLVTAALAKQLGLPKLAPIKLPSQRVLRAKTSEEQEGLFRETA